MTELQRGAAGGSDGLQTCKHMDQLCPHTFPACSHDHHPTVRGVVLVKARKQVGAQPQQAADLTLKMRERRPSARPISRNMSGGWSSRFIFGRSYLCASAGRRGSPDTCMRRGHSGPSELEG